MEEKNKQEHAHVFGASEVSQGTTVQNAKPTQGKGKTKSKIQLNSSMYEVLKALIISLVFTLAGILVFALFMKLVAVPDKAIAPVNQCIKMLSLLVACFFSFRSGRGGWRKGFVLGLIYIPVVFLIVSSIKMEIVFNMQLLYDVLAGCAMGLCSGVLAVNLRKPRTAFTSTSSVSKESKGKKTFRFGRKSKVD